MTKISKELPEKRKCEECKHNVYKYCDGFVFRDWSGQFEGNPSDLPKNPDPRKFWTYQECKKNVKRLMYLNLTGECEGFEKAKSKG